MRRLVYINREDEYIKIFNFTEEENKKYEEFIEDDDYYGDDFDVVNDMLKSRGANDEFPLYFVTECPVTIYDDNGEVIADV